MNLGKREDRTLRRESESRCAGDSQNGQRRQRAEVAALVVVVAVVVAVAHWPALSARALSFDDQEYLTENRLVTRLDKSKSAEAKGNGFVISEKGKRVVKGIR